MVLAIIGYLRLLHRFWRQPDSQPQELAKEGRKSNKNARMVKVLDVQSERL